MGNISQLTSTINSGLLHIIWVNVLRVMSIVALFFLFEENQEAGWKVIIPFYGTYTKFKLFYKKEMYWVYFIFSVLAFVGTFGIAFLGIIFASKGESYMPTDGEGIAVILFLIISIIALIVLFVIDIFFKISMAKKYNKGGLFVLGLIFLEPFMLVSLAWENRDDLKRK